MDLCRRHSFWKKWAQVDHTYRHSMTTRLRISCVTKLSIYVFRDFLFFFMRVTVKGVNKTEQSTQVFLFAVPLLIRRGETFTLLLRFCIVCVSLLSHFYIILSVFFQSFFSHVFSMLTRNINLLLSRLFSSSVTFFFSRKKIEANFVTSDSELMIDYVSFFRIADLERWNRLN